MSLSCFLLTTNNHALTTNNQRAIPYEHDAVLAAVARGPGDSEPPERTVAVA